MKYLNLKTILTPVLLGAASTLIISCQSSPRLEPLTEAPMGKDAVRTTTADVTVLADGSEWSGRGAVKTHVTPLKVEIRNKSEQPVRIRYQNFRVVTKKGTRFAALPLFEIEGSVQEPKAVSFARAPYQTRFVRHRLSQSPIILWKPHTKRISTVPEHCSITI